MVLKHPSDSLIVGLTGGIGSGKSTVAGAFRQLGIDTVDADLASRKVVQPGMPALARISEHFGEGIIQSDGSLDRAALRKIVFSDPQQKLWLETLLHPLIRGWIVEQLQQSKSPYVILESPLLFETDQQRQSETLPAPNCKVYDLSKFFQEFVGHVVWEF